ASPSPRPATASAAGRLRPAPAPPGPAQDFVREAGSVHDFLDAHAPAPWASPGCHLHALQLGTQRPGRHRRVRSGGRAGLAPARRGADRPRRGRAHPPVRRVRHRLRLLREAPPGQQECSSTMTDCR
ncbi:unnamed protein product, partial [Prorocentrum cordatum]